MCSGANTSWNLEFKTLNVRAILVQWRATKALIRLLGYAGGSVAWLVAFDTTRFSHDEAYYIKVLLLYRSAILKVFYLTVK